MRPVFITIFLVGILISHPILANTSFGALTKENSTEILPFEKISPHLAEGYNPPLEGEVPVGRRGYILPFKGRCPQGGGVSAPLNFVVIGAFVFQINARQFMQRAQKKQLNAKFALNPHRSLYYVYTYYTTNKEEAIEEVLHVREKYKIYDAWVYSGELDGVNAADMPIAVTKRPQGVKRTQAEIQSVRVESPLVVAEIEKPQTPAQEKTIQSPVNDVLAVQENEFQNPVQEVGPDQMVKQQDPTKDNVALTVQKPKTTEVIAAETPVVKSVEITEDYKMYISAVNRSRLVNIKGPVEIFDQVRNKKIAEAQTHEAFGLNDPNNGSASVRVVSRIFGYRPMQVVFSLNDPENDSTSVYAYGDSVIVDMKMQRLQRGDLAVLWNVLFYKDAAIMRSESKAELNSLLEMLQENANMQVLLHGHTNGNTQGNIIKPKEGSKDFFTLNADHDESVGSAKKLSEARANTIALWLMDQGIEAHRLEVKGWGGKRMLYSKNDAKAYQNVRVEVEIIAN
ncbi:MAG: OmpA family protein [Cyclobacteriaceae bacterium]|nr:OmpA family protein [Cyclobacteriaceae bacterium]